MHGNEYATPQWLYDAINAEFNFSTDLACTRENCKAATGYYQPEFDSLTQPWHKLSGWLWLNPPYSPLKIWIQKAQKEFLLGAKIVILCPPIISAKYFSEVIPAEIRIILGRVPFVLGGVEMKGNTSDSSIIIYGPPKISKLTYVCRDEMRIGF